MDGPAEQLGLHLSDVSAQGPVDEDRLSELLDSSESLLHNDPVGAEALAALVDTAADGRWPALQARARYQRAQVFADRGELREALELIGSARSLFEQAGDDLAGLRTDLGRMHILEDLGRSHDAIAVGEALIAALDAHPDRAEPLARRIRAHAMDNVGAAYGYIGEHHRALEAYDRARHSYLDLGLTEQAARPLANRGVELLALGRPREAMIDLRAAGEVFLASGDRLFAAQCQGDLATAHRQLGQFTQALAVLEPARRTLDELGAHAEADRLRLALAETYLALNLVPEARAAAQETADRAAAAGLVGDHGNARLLLGLGYLAGGAAQAAEIQLAQAEVAFSEIDDAHSLARTRLARAEVAALQGHTADALDRADAATRALAAGGWLPTLTWGYLRMVDWLEDSEHVSELLGRAGVLVEQLGLPDLSFAYELRRSRWLRQHGDAGKAEQILRRVVSDLDRAASALSDYVIQTAFRADRADAYDDLVDLLLDRGDVEAACAASDEAKARILIDLRGRAGGTGSADLGADSNDGDAVGTAVAGDELALAFADLNATYAALQAASDGTTRQALRARADELEGHVSRLRLRRAAAGQLTDVPTETSTPAVLASSADAAALPSVPSAPSAPALAFHVLGPDIVAFARLPHAVTAHRLIGATDRLAGQLDELAAQWTRRSRPGGSPHQQQLLLAATRRTLETVYDILLRPLAERIDELIAAGPAEPELRVVPHGLVGSVPFRALLVDGQYLIQRCAITVSPTLGAVGATPDRADALRPALVVCVPDESIPDAAEEADRVVAELRRSANGRPVQLLSGEDATVAAVLEAGADAAIIHLACHAVFRAENPLFSRLRLGDRWLTTAEIVRLHLPDALVTLSACDSGRADASAEPVGLGWAFLAAGAGGVVVSQWAVDDATARETMTHFYRELGDGVAPSVALRCAQQAAAAAGDHPFYWAPFTFISSPDS